MSKEHQPLHKANGIKEGEITTSAGWQNIGKVLYHSDSKTIQEVGAYYSPRCAHILKVPGATYGILVTEPTEEVRAHAEYLSAMYGETIDVYPLDQLSQPQNGSMLGTPYILSTEASNVLQRKGIIAWGLPPKMVDDLKDKGFSNRDMTERMGQWESCIRIPEHEVCDIADMVEVGKRFIQEKVTEPYQRANLLDDYNPGLVIRFVKSDGGYGNAVLERVGNSIIVTPNGNVNEVFEIEGADGWESALESAERVLRKTMNIEKSSEVIISRLVDYIDSPGLSLVIVEGEVYSLGWNGQLQEKGSTACIGTSAHKTRNPRVWWQRHNFQDRTAEDFAEYLRRYAQEKQIDFNSIAGLINIDLLIPSGIERKFLRFQGKKDNIVYGVEINPRWTNYTDALALAAWLEGLDHSAAGLRQAARRGVVAIDKFKITNGKTPDQLRNEMFGLDQQLRDQHNTRVFLRMPPEQPNRVNGSPRTAGVIIVGNNRLGKRKLKQLVK